MSDTPPNRPDGHKPALVLLVAPFSHPHKDLVATTLGWMCKAAGAEFDVYYAEDRADGGIFSPHGSAVVGGRHVSAVARALALYDTIVVRLSQVRLLDTLLRRGARLVIDAPASPAELYALMATRLDLALPQSVVAYQTQDLPAGLTHGVMKAVVAREGHKLADAGLPPSGGIVQYAFPEAVGRRALAMPLEAPAQEVARLAGMGARQVWTVAAADADTAAWAEAGLELQPAEVLAQSDDLLSLSFRVAGRWLAWARAVDLNEPLLASYQLPFCIREERLQVYGQEMRAAAARLAPLCLAKGQDVVYGRYAGGAFRGATSDEDLFDLFQQGIVFQVTEPGRPVLTLFGSHPTELPRPAQSTFDLEPDDEQLRAWAREGRVLVTLLTHSGELSHNDAVLNLVDLSATTGVKAGVGVHYQRYAFDPELSELLQVPASEGGALGLVEPVLHSGGYGIAAEALADPDRMARLMGRARDDIARLAGDRFAPRGVYLYCDAVPPHWERPAEALWQAIRQAGFEYVVSSLSPGHPRILHREGDFLVLNQCGTLHYPFSPFVRVDTAADLATLEAQLLASGRPGWILPVLDIPIYGYSNYLSLGDPFKRRGGLGQFYDYIRWGGKSARLISATPHTIARYARLLADMGMDGDECPSHLAPR